MYVDLSRPDRSVYAATVSPHPKQAVIVVDVSNVLSDNQFVIGKQTARQAVSALSQHDTVIPCIIIIYQVPVLCATESCFSL